MEIYQDVSVRRFSAGEGLFREVRDYDRKDCGSSKEVVKWLDGDLPCSFKPMLGQHSKVFEVDYAIAGWRRSNIQQGFFLEPVAGNFF